MSSSASVAEFLLKEGLLLTALELHAELVERGQTNRALKDFFDNAAHFEHLGRATSEPPAAAVATSPLSPLATGIPPSPCLSQSSIRHRAGSQATLDSLSLLDVTRYSEDSHAQTEDKVAVLEFELRKARDTIHALRKELTAQAENLSDELHPAKKKKKKEPGSEKEHVTSSSPVVTSSRQRDTPNSGCEKTENNDEDEEEDDEDEDVDEDVMPPIRGHEQRTLNYLVNEYLLQHGYKLTSITFSDENLEQDFEEWDSIGLNVAKPPNLLRLYRDFGRHVMPKRKAHDAGVQTGEEDAVSLLHEKIGELTVHLEEVEENNRGLAEALAGKEGDVEEYARCVEALERQKAHLEDRLAVVLQQQEEMTTTSPQTDVMETAAAAATNSDGMPPDLVTMTASEPNDDDTTAAVTLNPSHMFPASPAFLRHILAKCQRHCVSHDSPDPGSSHDDIHDRVICVLADSVPRILPNVLLAKRDELIPLLLTTIELHPDAGVRDKFLNLLFNLIKRPEEKQREMILRGFLAMAAKFGPTRIEAELLPQCWEQINHKYDERRILVAETCGLLMPYIPSELRSSLLLSMLQQLCLEDREVAVRLAAIDSLAVLVLYLHDGDKFDALWQLCTVLLQQESSASFGEAESVPSIVHETQQTLLPAVAQWAANLDGSRLESIVVTHCLEDFVRHCDLAEDRAEKSGVETRLRTMRQLLPFVIHSVIGSCPGKVRDDNEEEESQTYTDAEHVIEQADVIGIDIVIGASKQALVKSFRAYVEPEWFETWPQLQWFENFLFKRLVACVARVPLHVDDDPDSDDTLVESLVQFVEMVVVVLGAKYTQQYLWPRCCQSSLEADPGSDSCLIAVLVLGLLRHVKSASEVCDMLREWSVKHVEAGLSCQDILYAVRRLCGNKNSRKDSKTAYTDALAETAWSLVVHASMQVRAFAAELLRLLAAAECAAAKPSSGDDLLSSRLLPGLVTLSSDPEECVRLAALHGLGVVMAGADDDTAREKATFQLMTFLEDEDAGGHAAYLKVVQVVELVWQELPVRMREEVVLPRIVRMYGKYGAESDNPAYSSETPRTEMASTLLSALAHVSRHSLSVQTVHALLRPCLLHQLQREIRQLVPGLADRVDAILASLDSAYGSAAPAAADSSLSSSPGRSSANSVAAAAKMSQSPSLDEMKSKVGKLFQKQAGQVQFWKK